MTRNNYIVIARILLHILILIILSVPLSGFAAPVLSTIAPGLNVTGVTAELTAGQLTAFPLLSLWKPLGVIAIESYDANSGKMLRAKLDGNGSPIGTDFPLIENSALYVYSTQQSTLSLPDSTTCAPLNLAVGFNLTSHACFPVNYPASQFIASVGTANVTSLSRLDLHSGRWQTAAVDSGTIVGDDFPLIAGEGYIVYASGVVNGWNAQQLSLTPATLTAWQGQPDATLTVSIPDAAPPGGTQISVSSSNSTLVNLASQVTIPQGSSSLSIPLTLPDTGLSASQPVTVTASSNGFNSAQSILSIRPKPTVNLSPLTILTGQSWTYFLTVSLTETAPTGGLQVTLSPSPAGIVTCPATVTIPAGATSAQVTVTALSVGTATITASASPMAISGTTNTVTVKAIQTLNIGPMLSSPVGIMVSTPAPPTTKTIQLAPVMSSAVGVNVGSVITGVAPETGAIGMTGMKVTVTGAGLGTASAISFLPADGITLQTGTFAIDANGNPEVLINIAPTAPTTMRTVIVTLPSGQAIPAGPGANQFRVTLPEPQILGMQPIRAMAGQMISLNIFGKNFTSATSVDFTPATGIAINNPPTVNSAGDLVTVTVNIAADAPIIDRVVTISTPGWTSTATPSVANTFHVTADAGTTYTPLVSSQVGVLVQTTATANDQKTYTPLTSLPVGVAVGGVITSVTPQSGSVGAASQTVRVNGIGLAAATGLSFYPDTGIVVNTATFTAATDGSYVQVEISIDQSAPLTARTVLLGGITALPAGPEANQFKVTLPAPEIQAIQPIRQAVGSTFTLTILGKNLASASRIDFAPASGISVNNPPSVSNDGTSATVTVIIDANAPIGARVVSLTAPGGITSGVASAANSFTVTSDVGVVYTPVLSQPVGILVAPAAVVTSQLVTYNQLLSQPVGVTVTPVPAPTTWNPAYGPIVSQPIGVSVGPTITSIAPRTIEPGTTATITIYGAGLDQVNAVQMQPSAGFIINSVIPAPDGMSATVSITAEAAIAIGTKTMVVSTAAGTVTPAAPASLLLLAGPKPIISSMQIGAGSPLAVAGSTVTLTINGINLQSTSQVRFVPSDGIQVSNPPTWYSDGQGEHLSVTVFISATATGGDRVVIIDTLYGSTDGAPLAGNTFTIYQPSLVRNNAPLPGAERLFLARCEAASEQAHEGKSQLESSRVTQAPATVRQRDEQQIDATITAMYWMNHSSRQTEQNHEFSSAGGRERRHLFSQYRGPPGAMA